MASILGQDHWLSFSRYMHICLLKKVNEGHTPSLLGYFSEATHYTFIPVPKAKCKSHGLSLLQSRLVASFPQWFHA